MSYVYFKNYVCFEIRFMNAYKSVSYVKIKRREFPGGSVGWGAGIVTAVAQVSAVVQVQSQLAWECLHALSWSKKMKSYIVSFFVWLLLLSKLLLRFSALIFTHTHKYTHIYTSLIDLNKSEFLMQLDVIC